MATESAQKIPLFLVIERNAVVRDDLAFSLAAKFAAATAGVASVREAVEWIKEKNEYVSLIVVEDTHDLPNLLKYLAKNRIQTPCVLVTKNPEREIEGYLSPNLQHCVRREYLLQDLYALIPNLLQRESYDFPDEFCPFPTHLLERVSPVRGDVFIRLSDRKYIRIFAQNDFCSQADIEKYAVRKGVKYLYLRKRDVPYFMRAINEHLEAVLESIAARELSLTESDRLASETIDSVQSYVLRFGFTEEARVLAEKAIEITRLTISENAKLAQLFDRFIADNTRYTPAHSLVIAHVASAICAELQWNAKGTLYKLVLAAILHDIAVPNDALAAVGSLAELEARAAEFTEKELATYPDHPFLAMQVAGSFKLVPPDVGQIILQHHERPDGSGFPRGLTASNITPLASVFIMAHELVRRLLTKRERFHLEDEFLDLVKQFDHGPTFHSILGILDPYNHKQKLKFYG